MKIFNKTERWTEKVNFVDENNVMLGYDMSQSCCEDADWFVTDTLPTPGGDCIPDVRNQPGEDGLAEWKFDPDFKQEIEAADTDHGGMVAFRIVKRANGRDQKFIVLFNCHNGYYSHGFEFSVAGAVKEEGYL